MDAVTRVRIAVATRRGRESNVCEEDIAAARKKQGGEAVIDSCRFLSVMFPARLPTTTQHKGCCTHPIPHRSQ